ncbi:MAG: NAD-dependent epimerase/dehydratase family protein [Chloroflexi bacterium]|nr:NAD-dependent epimerase/dehydratase family protein [Chloroflexota bacterium]
MKICIVGGTGNISMSIVRLLVKLGHEVTCFNRGRSGEPPGGARVLEGDRSDRPAFEKAIQAERFDAGIDMICFSREDAESSVRAFQGVKHFIQCSTVCTYGIQYDWLPASEDHPLRPITGYGRGKVAADAIFMEAFYRDGFPVTIIKPSTTYGPKSGKGKPILVCGDGNALHQFLHVDDAALCFAHVPGKEHCIGQTYNMVRRGFTTWADYHRTAMKVLGREVELVGVPLADLERFNPPQFGICKEIFAHHVYYSAEKLFRDVPEFQPQVSLEQGMEQVFEVMDRDGRIPDSDTLEWEDKIIAAQRG